MKKTLFLFVILCFQFFAILFAAPNSISYQGRLRESGVPVSGTRNFNFKLFTEASVGTQIWTSGDIAVLVSSGIYSTQIGNDAVKSLDFANNDYWLEISVGGNAFTPREKISAVPYAFTASTATNLMGAGNIQMSGASGNHWIASGNFGIGTTNPVGLFQVGGGSLTVLSNGNTGIGITNPAAKLDVSGNIRVTGWSPPVSGIGTEMGYSTNAGGFGFIGAYDRTNLVYKLLNINDLLYINATSYMVGNIGVGVSNPSAALEVNGGIKISSAIYTTQWAGVSYGTGWSDYPGTTYQVVQYKKTGDMVYLRGLATSGSNAWTSNQTIFTLPEGFRPSRRLLFSVQTNSSTYGSVVGRIDISTNGNVTYEGSGYGSAGSGWVGFEGISFSIY